MPDASYAMVGFFAGSQGKWWKSDPVPCNSECKRTMTELILDELEETKLPKETGPMEINLAIKSSLEMKFNTKDNYPRSMIVISNGLFFSKDIHEETLANCKKDRKFRVSAIGIGNGSSDSFLRTIAYKGLGIFEVLNSSSKIEEKIEFFMKRLRWYTIDSITFDTKDASNILKIIPTFQKNQSILKGMPIEVFIYMKDKPSSAEGMQIIDMNYEDHECNKREKGSIRILLKTEPLAKELALGLHKLMVRRLLNFSVDMKASNTDTELVKHYGQDWATKIAVEHQILTHETSLMLVAHQLPEGFDILHGDIDQLNKVRDVAITDVAVKAMIDSDSLAQTNPTARKAITEVCKKNYSSVKFNKKRANTLSTHLNGVYSGSTTAQTNTLSSTSVECHHSVSVNGGAQSTINSIDANEIIRQILEEDDDEDDQDDNFSGHFNNKPESAEELMGTAKDRIHKEREHHSGGSLNNELDPIIESTSDNEDCKDDDLAEKMDIVTQPGVKDINTSDLEYPVDPVSPGHKLTLIVESQLENGSWDLSENLLSALGITSADLEKVAKELSNNPDLPIQATFTSEDILTLMCVAYLEIAKNAQKMRRANEYLIKTRKYSKIKDLVSAVKARLPIK